LLSPKIKNGIRAADSYTDPKSVPLRSSIKDVIEEVDGRHEEDGFEV
jgi:hypothetical protein